MDNPEGACVYDSYDPDTLQPLNEATHVRLLELGWCPEEFAGKTVLDIGCNSGLLSLHALRLGAAKVHACDVRPALTRFVAGVAARQDLPIVVSETTFTNLDPRQHGADIVLFMEVLHWVVAQGTPLRAAIARVASLTRETLYIEFPWSVCEPSIRVQTNLTEVEYSADQVLNELTRYFSDVRVVRFMRYFGFQSESKRLLVRARDKRPEADILSALPDAYSLDQSLSRGLNESYLIASQEGKLVAKVLDPTSALTRLPPPLCTDLFDELHGVQPKMLVLPKKIDGAYLLKFSASRTYMAFPFIGSPYSAAVASAHSLTFAEFSDLLIGVRRDFRQIQPRLLRALQEHGWSPNLASVTSQTAKWREITNGGFAQIAHYCASLVDYVKKSTPEMLDSLNHGDLQSGNFVLDRAGSFRVVDLDNMRLGTVYADGIMGLIWRGAPQKSLSDFCLALGPEEARPVGVFDVALAVTTCLGWFNTVKLRDEDAAIQEQIERFFEGVEQAIRFAKTSIA